MFILSTSVIHTHLLNKLNKTRENTLRPELRTKIVDVCNKKIAAKGDNVGLSFYAFFANKNDNPELLMEAATWWISTHELDHFEKALKIKKMVENNE